MIQEGVMTLKHLTIGKRIGLLSGCLLILLVAAGVLSVTGVGSIVHNAGLVISGNQLDGILAQKEVDHLNWANKVGSLFTDAKALHLEVETDDHKCGFGLWLYGDGRKEAEKLVPALAPMFKEIEAPHHRLHASAIEIGQRFHPADATLGSFLREKKIDHLTWTNRVKDALLDSVSRSVNVETDPGKCGLGIWMASEQAASAAAANPNFKAALAAVHAPHEALHRSASEISARLAQGDQGGANTFYVKETQKHAEQALKALDALIAVHEADMEGVRAAKAVNTLQTIPALKETQVMLGKIRAKARESILTDEAMLSAALATRRNVLILIIVAIVAGLSLSFLIVRGITRVLCSVSDGIGEAASQVATAAAEVSLASQSLASGATEQASSLEETSAAILEISSQGKSTAELTQGAEALMNRNIEKSAQSLKSLVDLTRQMSQIEADSDQIANIIKTIDGIAFQTNLLALNAAVEAARAGEAGAGFAVVADEVRNLAKRATEAARNTQNLLDGTMKRVADATISIKTINSDFEDIIESATVLGEKNASITQASLQQAEGLEQISKAVDQIDQVTQNVAAGAEEAAASSEELTGQAEEMRVIVAELSQMVYGNSHQAAGAALPGKNPIQHRQLTLPAPYRIHRV
jgi:methyl-accepting chemotaxis protein